jgi:hypothetical protein
VTTTARHATLAVILLLSTGCQSSQPASEAAKELATNAYVDCLYTAAAKMDDGTSDAMTVALAIKPLCASEFAQFVKLSGSHLSPYGQRIFEKLERNSQLEYGTAVVLNRRKGVTPK